MLSGASGVTNENLKMGRIYENDWPSINSGVASIESLPIHIDDRSALNLFEVRAKVRRMVQRDGVRILFVDYLQLMNGLGKNREEVISTISRGLKSLAKDLEIPIVALSQLNRSVETRGGDKKPGLSDLRESGAIEQDADVVLFMFRPEYYGMNEYQDYNGNEVPEGYTEIIIAKHRNGRLGIVPVVFVKKYSKFEDYENYSTH
jgi:replicative DNA helicase